MDREELHNYLASQNLMSLATCSEIPAACFVFYAMDEQFNLYFISEPATKHCSDIEKNNQVACMISDSNQKVTDKKIGVQIQGFAFELTDKMEIIDALKRWNQKNPGFENIIKFENLKKVIKSRVYKITPTVIKFFNEKLYGEEGFKIFNVSVLTQH